MIVNNKGKVVEVERTWLRSGEAAKYLGISEDTLQRITNDASARLVCSFYGTRLRWYRLDSLNRFLEANRIPRSTRRTTTKKEEK